jgi:chorismate mutase/prephenate dehydratase
VNQDLEELDRQIVELLHRRAVVAAARQGRSPPGKSASAPDSERLEGLQRMSEAAIAEILEHVDRLTRVGPPACRVAYLGPEYSYSHLAALKYFGEAATLLPTASIAGVFSSVARGDCDQGVVPVANSTDGRVVDTLDSFARQPLAICGEVLLPIHHYLLGTGSRGQIREIHSKPQAISQCRNWLAQFLPAVRLVEVTSTAAAAETAAQRPEVAAIASLEAGRRYGLRAIDEKIEDQSDNTTRFVVIGRGEPLATGDDKTSIVFQVPHLPGALADALNIFKTCGLNLTSIESFPLPGTGGEYLFFVELEGHRSQPSIGAALEQLRRQAVRLDVLGSYPRDRNGQRVAR